jgi:hypothetical protein
MHTPRSHTAVGRPSDFAQVEGADPNLNSEDKRMANENSSAVSAKAPVSRIPLYFLIGAVLGALPGALLFISDEPWKGGDSVTGMMGPVWILLLIFGGCGGGVLGLVVGVIAEWYRKRRAPQV